MVRKEKKKILLVDDDTSLLITLGDFLKFEGYQVVTADSGESALQKLDETDPHLIILDMSMPGMGGIGFLREISSVSGKPRYPVLVLTARANMAEFFANVEVDGFVAKPCDPKDLLLEVSRIIFLRSRAETEAGPDSEPAPARVLIGENEKSVRDSLIHAFSEAGYDAVGVASGPEVIENAVLQRPDLVVLKLIFENMNGDTVAALLREMPKTADVPILVYDDSGSGVSRSSYAVSRSTVSRFVMSNEPSAIVSAADELLREPEAGV